MGTKSYPINQASLQVLSSVLVSSFYSTESILASSPQFINKV